MVEVVKQFASGIYNLLLGMFTSGKHLTRHAITVQYPKERWEVPERSRGMVVLLTDHETGRLNCTACLLCMRGCPSGAIDIEVEKDEKGKRHLKNFTVDFHLCCFCGLCEEACNFAAIKLSRKYEFPEYDKKDLIYDIQKLQAAGLDVPYEKPVRNKVEPKTPSAAPAAAGTPTADTPPPPPPPAAEGPTPTEAG
ncbi:MAG: NADH-quinone oxidoreductase subunit I [candidate division Zixibacteria bacterium]|nr:NADH-quinone oxidoreductase subunit I [candidate division Zixibacteria bacterium]